MASTYAYRAPALATIGVVVSKAERIARRTVATVLDTVASVVETVAPEATAPEATAPEATAPEATAPEATAPEATDTIVAGIVRLFVGTLYTFNQFHTRGSMWVSFNASPRGSGQVVCEVAHFATVPTPADTLTLTPSPVAVAGATVAYVGPTKAGRYTFRLPGHKGTWTIHALAMPAGSIVDGIVSPFLLSSLPLQGSAAVIAPADTTAAVIAGANMAVTVDTGVTATPADIADVQADLGSAAVTK